MTVLPPEWHKQSFVQIILPNKNTDWADMLDEVLDCYKHIAQEISRRQKLLVVCDDAAFAKTLLGNSWNIIFAEVSYNDTWARDCGGITILRNGKPVVLDFTFNGWGLKFAADKDNLLTEKLFKHRSFPISCQYKDCRSLILEGGSIESDGKGTILTTAQCLLSENRNYLSREALETKLKKLLDIERVLWLNNGYLTGDDTDSHIDTLARFCPDDTIVYVKCEDENDEHFSALQAMENELKTFCTLGGKLYRLLPVPLPDAVYNEGERLPATYANFLVINGAVLCPTYNQPDKDKRAKVVLQRAFPDREIIGIDCTALIKQHGSLHCAAMQFPDCLNR